MTSTTDATYEQLQKPSKQRLAKLTKHEIALYLGFISLVAASAVHSYSLAMTSQYLLYLPGVEPEMRTNFGIYIVIALSSAFAAVYGLIGVIKTALARVHTS